MTATPLSASGRTATTVAFCFVAAMCEGMDVQTAGVAAAGITRAFRPTPAQLGFFFAAANIGLILGAVAGGRISDRIGRKPVLVASLAAFGLFSLATGVAWDLGSLTVARFLTGLGLGGAMPNLIALVADVTGERSRNATIATTYVGMPVGGTVASLIVLALTPAEWRWLFVLGGAAPLFMAVLMTRFLRAKPAGEAAADRREAGPITDLFSEGRLARTLVLWLGFLAAALTLHLMLNWLPFLLQERGLAKGDAARAQVAFNLIGAAAAFGVGLVLDTRGRLFGAIFSIAAIPLALLLLSASAQAVGLMLAAGLLGGGVMTAFVILYGAAGAFYPKAVRGAGMGAAVGASRVGALAGPTLGAVLVSAGRTSAEVLTSLLPVVMALGACVAWLSWASQKPAAAARLAI